MNIKAMRSASEVIAHSSYFYRRPWWGGQIVFGCNSGSNRKRPLPKSSDSVGERTE